ncbi:MAG: response regulator, partial [Bdellovibrionia bacterium]
GHMETRSQAKLQGVRVLLVDDSEEGQVLLSKYLRAAGATVDTAATGQEGIKKALENIYDVVVTDIQMPDVNGYEVASLLRQNRYPRPIIAITGHVTKGERERCLRAGCDDQLTKPIDAATIVEVVAKNSDKFVDPKKPTSLTLH